jgi:hypothetical protein
MAWPYCCCCCCTCNKEQQTHTHSLVSESHNTCAQTKKHNYQLLQSARLCNVASNPLSAGAAPVQPCQHTPAWPSAAGGRRASLAQPVPSGSSCPAAAGPMLTAAQSPGPCDAQHPRCCSRRTRCWLTALQLLPAGPTDPRASGRWQAYAYWHGAPPAGGPARLSGRSAHAAG